MELKTKQLQLELYKKLYLIRRAEERIKDLYSEDEMKTPMHMSMGAEAIAAGVCAALKKQDQVFGTYRSHALYLAKSGETDKFFAELYGRSTGAAGGKAGSMHLAFPEAGVMQTSAVVGTTIPVAVGAALAHKIKKDGKMTAVFFGDGAVNEGVFWESLNFAALKKLPILFVCEDNELAIHSHAVSRLAHSELKKIAQQFALHTEKSETTDVFEIYTLAQTVLEKMRQDSMPGFLHLKYYRYLEHVGVGEDFESGYRSREEFVGWHKKDPIALQRTKLVNSEVTEKEITLLETKINKQIHTSIDRAKQAPFPKATELFTHLFSSNAKR